MLFVQSLDNFLIKKQVEKVIKKINANQEYEVFEFSLIDDPLYKIIEEITTYSLFASKKIVIISEAWFVNESKVKLHKDFDVKKIEKILSFNNPDVEIIFTLNSDKFSKKLKIAKLTEQMAEVLKLDPPNVMQKKVIAMKRLEAKSVSFDENAIDLFLEYISDDMQVFTNELSKLVTLNKHISVEIIQEFINKYYQFDVFEILNAFVKGDFQKFISDWRAYTELNANIFGFIALLGNQLIMLRNALLLKESRLSPGEIASKLGKNPYVIKKILDENNSTIGEINDKIKVLYALEKNIKEGRIDNKVIPEVEFIKMFYKH